MSGDTERDDEPSTEQSVLSELFDGPGVFVAGTGTGVGKTIVTAGITGTLRSRGTDATAIKPAQTGAPADDDAALVATACDDPNASTCLERMEPALAPRVAAELEDVSLDYDELLADCKVAVQASAFPVVEGIGGIRVPLAQTEEVVDLIADLGLPTIVVARAGLGTLNHTALTVDALRDRGLTVPFVILNEYEGATVAERTNPAELRRMLDVPIATIPPFDADDPSSIVPEVQAALEAADVNIEGSAASE